MKKKNLKKLSLDKKVISRFQQQKILGGTAYTIGGCRSNMGTCGPPESLEAYPAPCPIG